MQFSTYIFSADISPEMLKLGRGTKVKVLFLVLVFDFNFDLFKFSAAILEKGLLKMSKHFFLTMWRKMQSLYQVEFQDLKVTMLKSFPHLRQK